MARLSVRRLVDDAVFRAIPPGIEFAQTEGIGFLMAQAVFAGLPVLLPYLFFQRHIIGAVAGGVTK